MKNRKRTLKNLFAKKIKGDVQYNLTSILSMVAIIAATALIVTQLATNAILTPKGAQLERLNSEKNLLLENNRKLEEDIAKDNSFIMIKTYSEKKFDLKEVPAKDTVYVSNNTIQASKD